MSNPKWQIDPTKISGTQPEKTILSDALFNTSPATGASADYGKGIIVGIVTALMSVGVTFPDAIKIVQDRLPAQARPECMPDAWADILKDRKIT